MGREAMNERLSTGFGEGSGVVGAVGVRANSMASMRFFSHSLLGPLLLLLLLPLLLLPLLLTGMLLAGLAVLILDGMTLDETCCDSLEGVLFPPGIPGPFVSSCFRFRV